MARKKRNEILVGAFVAVSLALLVLLLILKGTLSGLFSPQGQVQVVLEDIRGLKVGDPVFYLGAKVGGVTSVEFARKSWGREAVGLFPDEKGEKTRVLITLSMPENVRKLLRTNSTVDIDKNLTGNISVLIGEGDGAVLPDERPLLKGSPGVELTEIAGVANSILLKFSPAVEDLAGLARRLAGSGDLETAAADLAGLARELREGLGAVRTDLDALLVEARGILHENRADIRAAASNLAEGSGLARRVLEKLEPAAGELRGALAQLEKAGSAVSGAIQGNRASIDAILEDVRTSVASATQLTADIRRRPWRLLYKPSKSEEESLDLYDAAWAYNLGASDLERSLRALTERLQADPEGKNTPEAVRFASKQVEESLKRHREAEEAFFKRLKGR